MGNQWNFFNNRIRKESCVSLSTYNKSYILIHTPYRVLTPFKYEHSSTAVPNFTKKKFTIYVYSSTGAIFFMYTALSAICIDLCACLCAHVHGTNVCVSAGIHL